MLAAVCRQPRRVREGILDRPRRRRHDEPGPVRQKDRSADLSPNCQPAKSRVCFKTLSVGAAVPTARQSHTAAQPTGGDCAHQRQGQPRWGTEHGTHTTRVSERGHTPGRRSVYEGLERERIREAVCARAYSEGWRSKSSVRGQRQERGTNQVARSVTLSLVSSDRSPHRDFALLAEGSALAPDTSLQPQP